MSPTRQPARVLIKICGVTRVEDAVAAAGLGVDAIGLNFWPRSPRVVRVERAAQIAAAVRGGPRVVAVFVDAADEHIDDVRQRVGVDVVQLHGREPPSACERFAPHEHYKAVRTLDELGRYRCRHYLFDAAVPGLPGGTGVAVDPELARQAARRASIILAGGLRPETVTAVVRDVRPAGVDVASGVESAPGIKDPDRMAAFVRAVHEAQTP